MTKSSNCRDWNRKRKSDVVLLWVDLRIVMPLSYFGMHFEYLAISSHHHIVLLVGSPRIIIFALWWALFALRPWSGDHPLYFEVSAFVCKASEDLFKDRFGTYLLLYFPGAVREENIFRWWRWNIMPDRLNLRPNKFLLKFPKSQWKSHSGIWISEFDP